MWQRGDIIMERPIHHKCIREQPLVWAMAGWQGREALGLGRVGAKRHVEKKGRATVKLGCREGREKEEEGGGGELMT